MLRWLHLAVGLGGLGLFAYTGQFMDRQLDHLVGMADGPRALYRSAHIYLLFSALLNFVLGIYLRPASTLISKIGQYLGSAFLVVAFGYFVYGFFVETPLAQIERPAVRQAIYWSLYGVLLHGGAALIQAEASKLVRAGRGEVGTGGTRQP